MQVLNDGLDYDRPIQLELPPESVRSKKLKYETNDIELLQDDEKANLKVNEDKSGETRNSNDSRNAHDFQSQVENRLKESMIQFKALTFDLNGDRTNPRGAIATGRQNTWNMKFLQFLRTLKSYGLLTKARNKGMVVFADDQFIN